MERTYAGDWHRGSWRKRRRTSSCARVGSVSSCSPRLELTTQTFYFPGSSFRPRGLLHKLVFSRDPSFPRSFRLGVNYRSLFRPWRSKEDGGEVVVTRVIRREREGEERWRWSDVVVGGRLSTSLRWFCCSSSLPTCVLVSQMQTLIWWQTFQLLRGRLNRDVALLSCFRSRGHRQQQKKNFPGVAGSWWPTLGWLCTTTCSPRG